MEHSNINFKPKYCFRVLSGKNANILMPPLIVDFFTEFHKYVFLSQCRGLIKEFKDTGESLIYACGNVKDKHWINYVTMAPDRSYTERKTYKDLKEQALAMNSDLIEKGIFNR